MSNIDVSTTRCVEITLPAEGAELALYCAECDAPLCDVEPGDDLYTLVAVAAEHVELGHPAPCSECGAPTRDRFTAGDHGMCPSCLHDALRSGWSPS